MDGTSNGAMQWGRYDIRPERLEIYYYECNEAEQTRETLQIYYYECNEADKTRETLQIGIGMITTDWRKKWRKDLKKLKKKKVGKK